MKAVFRCDASAEIGSGHVYRCMTLADELLRRGWECLFLAAPGSEDIAPGLLKPEYGLARSVIYDLSADVLISDHYELDAEFEGACRDWAKKIAVIDDLADRAHDCDVLIDQTYGRDAADYAGLVPPSAQVLTGAGYALLRPQFEGRREGSLQRRAQKNDGRKRVLVSLGSTNLKNVTGAALAALRGMDVDVDVVLGAGAPGAEEVKALAKEIGAAYHESVSDMAGLMAAADVAIGAGGTTSWERCCMGLPTVMVEVADNQSLIARKLDEAEAVLNLGHIEEVGPKDIAAAVGGLLKSPEKLIQMSGRAAAICDGGGAGKVADILAGLTGA